MGIHSRIELLAPARDLGTGRAAVDCGADAVYIGGPVFGARHAAGNPVEDVAALVRYARPFGVRVYATLNTLLFDNELAAAERTARELMAAGVDALIVQDMAFLRMGLSEGASLQTRAMEFHASTQTSNMAPEDVAFLGRAGFSRIILERALSFDEIKKIRAATDAELEVFVHGAICVGYSGRCFMSRAAGAGLQACAARSGNRGECSQPCRLPYDLTDGEGNMIAKGKHLLSVRDLDLSAHIGELLDAGITSFKIEGRLKDAHYVRNLVGHYRRLIDGELAVRPHLRRASAGIGKLDFTPDPSKSFTRGATDYFFSGAAGGVASFDTPKSVGEAIGRVEKTGCERTGNRFFTIAGDADRLVAGDGICFFSQDELQGTNINRIEGGRIYPNRMEGITAGTNIFRNYDHAFTRMLERSRTRRRIGVAARVEMSATAVSVVFTDTTGLSAAISREGVFDETRDPAKMLATLRKQLSRSGDTIFEVNCVEVGDEVRFVPVSALNELRREGLAQLLARRERLAPERNPAVEDVGARFPRTRLRAAENVTNHLAERFYRDHGVTEIAPALELRPTLDGEVVMRSRYCIRRETGRCLLRKPVPKGDLYLEHGNIRYRIDFDCTQCEMSITKI